jgi:hypothetical protein
VEESSECADAAALYRGKFDWPCTAHGYAVWTLAGEALDAVDLPEWIGPPVVSALGGRDRPRAVIEVPGDSGYWRFLVRPRQSLPVGLVRELGRQGVRYLGNGMPIELPPTRVPGAELRWHGGVDGRLPSLVELLDAMSLGEHKSSER